jgi:hypothetical protein
MLIFIITLLLISSSLLPQLWVKYILIKYQKNLPNMPGTGGELAQHLLNNLNMKDTQLEECAPWQDHFDPSTNTVRLSPAHFNGKSLTAIAVAAHEVGHAIQHHRKEKVAQLRMKYIPLSIRLQKAGTFLLMVLPIILLAIKAPVMVWGILGISLILQIASALTYLIILPEEWDASFNKALPLLTQGGYLPDEYTPTVHKILTAAALTYFASALANVLNIGRWLLILRR